LFAAANAKHVSPAFAVLKVLQSGEIPAWVLRAGGALLVELDEDVAEAEFEFEGAIGGLARTYQPPGGEVQSFVPGLRSEQDLKRAGFQAVSWAAVKFPEVEAMREGHVVVLGVTVTWVVQFDEDVPLP
jgi:hypothetical protein